MAVELGVSVTDFAVLYRPPAGEAVTDRLAADASEVIIPITKIDTISAMPNLLPNPNVKNI